jgi:hypothetical protein
MKKEAGAGKLGLRGCVPVWLFVGILCGVIWGEPGPRAAAASTVKHFDLVQLTDNAAGVFVGTCQKVGSRIEGGRIYTQVEFAVDETLKGEIGSTLELELLGGVYEGLRLEVAGMPAFAIGEDVVLFLSEKDNKGRAWPVGLAQGKFRIETQGAAKTVRRDMGGLELYGAAKSSGAVLQDMELGAFLERVRRYAGQRPDDGRQ